MTQIQRRQERCGTTAQWAASVTALFLGEIGVETDNSGVYVGTKVGDGVHLWAALTYVGTPLSVLDVRYPPISIAPARRAAGQAIQIGDSLTANGDSVSALVDHTLHGESMFAYATQLCRQRLRYVRNSGFGGDTTTMMLARFDTDVLAYNPSVVIFLGGTNDSATSTPLATFAANVQAVAAKCSKAGISLILMTMPPNGNTPATRKTFINIYNAWLRDYAGRNGILLVDLYDLLVDPSTGNITTLYNQDGTHLTPVGYYAAGKAIAAVVDPLAPPGPLPSDNLDPLNLITNGCFVNTTGSGTTLRPTGWSQVGSAHPTGVTATFVTPTDPTIIGQEYTLTVAAPGSAVTDTTFLTVSGIIPGHVYRFMGRFKLVAPTNVLTLTTRLLFNALTTDGYHWRGVGGTKQEILDGQFLVDATAPSDATTVQVNHALTCPIGSTGVCKLSQIGLYDLTANGLA